MFKKSIFDHEQKIRFVSRFIFRTVLVILVSSIFASLVLLINGHLINKLIPSQGVTKPIHFDYSVDQPIDTVILNSGFTRETSYSVQIFLVIPYSQPISNPTMIKTKFLTHQGELLHSDKKLLPYDQNPPESPSFLQIINYFIAWLLNPLFSLDFTGVSNKVFSFFIRHSSTVKQPTSSKSMQDIFLQLSNFEISTQFPAVLEIELSEKLISHSSRVIIQADSFFSRKFGKMFTVYHLFWPILENMLICMIGSFAFGIIIAYRQFSKVYLCKNLFTNVRKFKNQKNVNSIGLRIGIADFGADETLVDLPTVSFFNSDGGKIASSDFR